MEPVCDCKWGLYLTGEEWLDGAIHPQQDADQADSSHLQQDQQVHVRFPEYRRCLWHRELPGNQPRLLTNSLFAICLF